MTPFLSLDFLYVPAPDIEVAVKFYRDVVGGRVRWKIHAFGAWVACVELSGEGPPLLLADHKEPRGPQLVYRVASFADAHRQLLERGLTTAGEPFEIPAGPCWSFRDPAGNELAIYENRRPQAAASFEGRFD